MFSVQSVWGRSGGVSRSRRYWGGVRRHWADGGDVPHSDGCYVASHWVLPWYNRSHGCCLECTVWTHVSTAGTEGSAAVVMVVALSELTSYWSCWKQKSYSRFIIISKLIKYSEQNYNYLWRYSCFLQSRSYNRVKSTEESVCWNISKYKYAFVLSI